jgi:methyl-CpG-binding domain protein 4
MWKFFERYPTPTAASAAHVDDIVDMIDPLGLSKRRSRALIRMSYDYINEDWRDDPAVLYGVGKYASDAYRIFCLGEWKDVRPKDHALNDYHNWLKKENHNTLL